MLVQFSVKNFLSFDEEVVFSMVAIGADQQHPTHLIPDTPRKSDCLLRAAALYGANASGKSNLVLAMRFARDLIISGTRGSQLIPNRPFKMGADISRPTKFEFTIKTRGILYNYGFSLDGARIIEEWLFATPNKQEVLYFQRTTTKDNKVKVEFGPSFTGRGKTQRQFLRFVAQGTRPNQLFFTEAVERNVSKIVPVYLWFDTVCMIIRAEARTRDLEGSAHVNADFTKFLGEFLRVAGTGIDAVATEELPFDFDRYTPDMPPEQRQEVREGVAQLNSGAATLIASDSGERFFVMKGSHDEPVLVQLKLQHRAKDGHLVPFNIEEESEGTQRLIHLLPALFNLNRTDEQVIIIDELDRRMHPLLSRLLVQAALACDEKHRQSQLIFTTHDTNLLDLDMLRRDEIWFVEKDNNGASHIYSLAEFKIRPDLKIEKGYLSGRFGAIPFIGDIRSLGWFETEKQSSEKTLEAEVGQAA